MTGRKTGANGAAGTAGTVGGRKGRAMTCDDVLARVERTVRERELALPDAPAVLMVSGGSDSTALAYLAVELRARGVLGQLAIFHLNHHLRGRDADDDAAFVRTLSQVTDVPLFERDADVPALLRGAGGNVEAVAREVRYDAAREVLRAFCDQCGVPAEAGRLLTAHTADDRVESFYMRSIVGTGPGGLRGMRYRTGSVARPCLDVTRAQLQQLVRDRAAAGLPVARDGEGALWRTDATNAHTDRFRAYVRACMVPAAAERNPRLLDVLCRTMNLIADEDDLLAAQADALAHDLVGWLDGQDPRAGCAVSPQLAAHPVPLQRRVLAGVLQQVLGPGARIESASVEACTAAFDGAQVRSGYVANIQGDLAVSANKRGVRIEPMSAFRARRKRIAPGGATSRGSASRYTADNAKEDL